MCLLLSQSVRDWVDHSDFLKVLEKRKSTTPGGNRTPDNPFHILIKQKVWEEDGDAGCEETDKEQSIHTKSIFLDSLRDRTLLGLIMR
jgi:hypothetical protein